MNLEIFNSFMRAVVGEDFLRDLSRVLSENNAIIAGGSVLAPYYYLGRRIHGRQDKFVKDLDIYTNVSSVRPIYNFLEENGYEYTRFTTAPAYDESFLRRNNIVARIVMKKRRAMPIDLIVVNDSTSPVDVASNFDLTFCEIWYDGDNVLANYPNDIDTKSGSLKPDYVKGLLQDFNAFTRKRINKYTKKGFVVQIPTDNEGYTINKKAPRRIVSEEEWFVKALYRNANPDFFIQYPLQVYTLDNFMSIINDPNVPQETVNRMFRKFSRNIPYLSNYYMNIISEMKERSPELRRRIEVIDDDDENLEIEENVDEDGMVDLPNGAEDDWESLRNRAFIGALQLEPVYAIGFQQDDIVVYDLLELEQQPIPVYLAEDAGNFVFLVINEGELGYEAWGCNVSSLESDNVSKLREVEGVLRYIYPGDIVPENHGNIYGRGAFSGQINFAVKLNYLNSVKNEMLEAGGGSRIFLLSGERTVPYTNGSNIIVYDKVYQLEMTDAQGIINLQADRKICDMRQTSQYYNEERNKCKRRQRNR